MYENYVHILNLDVLGFARPEERFPSGRFIQFLRNDILNENVRLYFSKESNGCLSGHYMLTITLPISNFLLISRSFPGNLRITILQEGKWRMVCLHRRISDSGRS